MSIVILVPSRGRPDRAAAMAASVKATANEVVRVVVLIDADEPRLLEYAQSGVELLTFDNPDHFTGALNRAAPLFWEESTILGAFGDDVAFRTPGWDRIVEDALATPGIAYPRDGIHDKGHPTAVWMSSVIARSLGWLAMPFSKHLWVDDAWKRLGQEAGVLRFLPDVYCEHLHPAAGKAEMDETYHRVYEGNRGHADHIGFMGWLTVDLASDAAKVRAVLP